MKAHAAQSSPLNANIKIAAEVGRPVPVYITDLYGGSGSAFWNNLGQVGGVGRFSVDIIGWVTASYNKNRVLQ